MMKWLGTDRQKRTLIAGGATSLASPLCQVRSGVIRVPDPELNAWASDNCMPPYASPGRQLASSPRILQHRGLHSRLWPYRLLPQITSTESEPESGNTASEGGVPEWEGGGPHGKQVSFATGFLFARKPRSDPPLGVLRTKVPTLMRWAPARWLDVLRFLFCATRNLSASTRELNTVLAGAFS